MKCRATKQYVVASTLSQVDWNAELVSWLEFDSGAVAIRAPTQRPFQPCRILRFLRCEYAHSVVVAPYPFRVLSVVNTMGTVSEPPPPRPRANRDTSPQSPLGSSTKATIRARRRTIASGHRLDSKVSPRLAGPAREEYAASFRHVDATSPRISRTLPPVVGENVVGPRPPPQIATTATRLVPKDPSTRPTLSWRHSSTPSETEESEIRVKGINFTAGLEAVQRIYGTTARNSVEKQLTGEAGEALRFGGLVIGGWYPVSWYREFWLAAQAVLDADEAAARRIGKLATEISVSVAYRALARIRTWSSRSSLVGTAQTTCWQT